MYRGEEVAQKMPGDVAIVAIRWQGEKASDISFELRVETWRGTLTCLDATNMRIELDQTGYTGVIPSWGFEVARENGRWNVGFDISSVGSVTLECSDVQLEVQGLSNDG